MPKYVAAGALVGILVGLIVQVIFPNILGFETLFNKSFRQQAGIPTYPQYSSGSILAMGFIVPMLLGILGGAIGYAVYKLKFKK